ncbi:tyrosine-type recombinase/integrase [Paenibacillus ehimensis]|uniref:Tyrosine-type recombinase/integrase n=1 Tax=Paenibacillus ehimensis TaxID=79264 RepID=A0ABT8VFG7_9BACL|nr:tyrosine-type recombinase/integrase [Paenibacillus ehimensis]MDO3679728.1 tyrosine-type recombinase/integrase [Paenibacillus ehimensis]
MIFLEGIDDHLNQYTLENVLENYIHYLNTEVEISKATVSRYKSAISLLIKWLKENGKIKFFDEITSYDLHTYINKTNEFTGISAKAKTKAVLISAIKNLYKWAINQNIVSSDISRFIQKPKINELLPEILLLEDATKFETSSMERKFSSRDNLITLLFLLRGLKVSELISIDLKNVNLNNSTIVYAGKGGISRTIYLTQKLIMILEKYIPERQAILVRRNKISEPALFISEKRGTRLTQRAIQLIIEEIGQKAKVKTTPNKLRHTCAAMLYNNGNGANISEIAKLLGHKDPYSANKYTKLNKDIKIYPNLYSTNPLELT